MTYLRQFNEAMKASTREQADAWLASEIQVYATRFRKNHRDAQAQILRTIRHFADQSDAETYARAVAPYLSPRIEGHA